MATILARLEEIEAVDDQVLCAALLHDTVEDTPYSLAALRRDFGTGIAAMVTEHMALDRVDGRRRRQPTQVMATMTSADTRVVAMKMADRLHNMQTLQFIPQAKQVRKAREVLDTFLPVAQQLSMPTVRSQLQALAQAALIRNRPSYPSRRRVIVALDIERSTTRPDGCYGEALDIAFRLLDAPRVKTALRASPGPLVLVISGDVYSCVVRDAPRGAGRAAFHRLVTAQVAGNQHQGWIHLDPAV